MTKIDWRNDVDVYHIPEFLQWITFNSFVLLASSALTIWGIVMINLPMTGSRFSGMLVVLLITAIICTIDWYKHKIDQQKEDAIVQRGFNN